MNGYRIPNLFIVGAPKCGTTALSHYLAGHPSIYMSEQSGNKEPEYFAGDFRFGWTAVPERSAYLSLFRDAPSGAKYLGEASVSYLHSKLAAEAILRESPIAKFIAMIRNPIEIAQRLHNQHVKHSLETVVDFERAWRLQESRLAGVNVPARFRDGRALQYGELSRIGEQLSRWSKVVPKEQMHVIVYEDFLRSPISEYESLSRFLGIEDDSRVRFPVMNPSVRYRIVAVQRFLMWARNQRERMGLPGGLGINWAIDRLNTRPGLPGLQPGFRRELQNYFREDIKIVSGLLDRDFSHWLE